MSSIKNFTGEIMEITTKNLIQRINRKLGKRREALRVLRGPRCESDLGRYYVVDLDSSVVLACHCDLEAMGRELGLSSY